MDFWTSWTLVSVFNLNKDSNKDLNNNSNNNKYQGILSLLDIILDIIIFKISEKGTNILILYF